MFLGTSTDQRFSALSLRDLLEARENFHVHLLHKRNVVGTAIGRYLIRKSDPYPKADKDKAEKRPDFKPAPKPPRTLENSEVREYSWPCVLVFVSEWIAEARFGGGRSGVPSSEFIPKTIYLPDGRSVPICTVAAPYAPEIPGISAPTDFRYPGSRIGGGYPLLQVVQGATRLASIGCLVTDGHKHYVLTSGHVTGDGGVEISTMVGGELCPIGITTSKRIRKVRFTEVYPGWPGKELFLNVDVGLIELSDLSQWTSQIFGVGALGPLADLSVYNYSLDLVGLPVRAYGARSGSLVGAIKALFFRYKAVGGFEYVADFLIGSRDDTALKTAAGDSGSVWVAEEGEGENARMPLAVQWGGAVVASETTGRLPFALATNLSAVLRDLDVDLVRGRQVGAVPYWGTVGHYTIGRIACDLVGDAKLAKLMLANRLRVSFERGDIDASLKKEVKASGFVPLANVPDIVWKKGASVADGGRFPSDNPTHYADLDEVVAGQTLFDRLSQPADLTVELFQEYYDNLGHTSPRSRGLLPLRVWQFFTEMVGAVGQGDLARYVCAAGILSHFVGDACQTLHGSYLADGDPARAKKVNGKTVKYGSGIHSAYEDAMVNKYIVEIMDGVDTETNGQAHGLALVSTGQEAAFWTVELMRRTRDRIPPMDLVEEYVSAKADGENVNDRLWTMFGDQTISAITDGCRVLAMLWESAWTAGGGAAVPGAQLKILSEAKLMALYQDSTFVPSVDLDSVAAHL